MKPVKFAKYKDNPAVKGLLSVEDLVKADWEHNYKKKGIPLDSARIAVKQFVDDGHRVYRLRNTLIFLDPDVENEDVEFHTVTADPYEVYVTMMQRFMLGLVAETGADTAFTYVDDKNAYRMAKKAVGEGYADIEESDEPQKGKYKVILEIGTYYHDMKQRADQQGAR